MSVQTYLADQLVVQRQAELLDDAERRAIARHLGRTRPVVARTGTMRKRIGAIVINVGQRIHGPVVTPPTIARWQGQGGSSSATSLRLF